MWNIYQSKDSCLLLFCVACSEIVVKSNRAMPTPPVPTPSRPPETPTKLYPCA